MSKPERVKVAALAAQMAGGSGDANLEFHGDAGELHHRDLAKVLPPDYQTPSDPTAKQLIAAGRTPTKLRCAVSAERTTDALTSDSTVQTAHARDGRTVAAEHSGRRYLASR